MLNLFLEYGVDVNIQDTKRQTCIFYAIEKGRYDFILGLIKAGANLSIVDKKRQSPYGLAKKIGRSDIVELLVANGADDSKTKKVQSVREDSVAVSAPDVREYKVVRYNEEGVGK